MKILMTGATGLLGSALSHRLADAGHDLVCAGRRRPERLPPRAAFIEVDFAHDTAARWAPRLAGIDAVVNAVGIFRQEAPDSFERLHVQGPRALFEGCVVARVRRVVHVSALGADVDAATDYHLSKRRGDDALLALPLDAFVVQPSLIFSGGGASSQAFLGLAALPVLPLPEGGVQMIQPLHLDDATRVLQALLEAPPQAGDAVRRVALVGPRAVTLRDYLASLRSQLGLGRGRVLRVPAALMTLAARLGDRFSGALFDSAAWSMLRRGNTAPPADTARLLGHPPRGVDEFIEPAQAPALRLQAQLTWLMPLLRVSMAAVWIVTGIVSLGLYPVEASLDLLARAGVPAPFQAPALYGAALLDLAFGLLTLMPLRAGRRRLLWLAQAALIAGYTAIITVRLPEFWLHPYGPLSKNLPMLAILCLLWSLDRPARRP